MAAILRQLPFFTEPTAVVVGGEVITIRPFQAVVWVSLAPAHQEALSPSAARFPAVLDTGHTHNFSIRQQHVRQWAGIDLGALPASRPARINRVPVPLLA